MRLVFFSKDIRFLLLLQEVFGVPSLPNSRENVQILSIALLATDFCSASSILAVIHINSVSANRFGRNVGWPSLLTDARLRLVRRVVLRHVGRTVSKRLRNSVSRMPPGGYWRVSEVGPPQMDDDKSLGQSCINYEGCQLVEQGSKRINK